MHVRAVIASAAIIGSAVTLFAQVQARETRHGITPPSPQKTPVTVTPIAEPKANTNAVKWKYATLGVVAANEEKSIWMNSANAEKIPDNTKVFDALNIMGQKGWELAGVDRAVQRKDDLPSMLVFYFKQPSQ